MINQSSGDHQPGPRLLILSIHLRLMKILLQLVLPSQSPPTLYIILNVVNVVVLFMRSLLVVSSWPQKSMEIKESLWEKLENGD